MLLSEIQNHPMSIKDNIKTFNDKLKEYRCLLVAVSKTKPNEDILLAYEAGQFDFGENKVQELSQKAAVLPKEIHWHMIGHLQRNKVKDIAPFVHLIHAVDSMRLLREINKQALNNERVIKCLLQVHIADESTKFGLSPSELKELLESEELKLFVNINIIGFMGMATYTTDSAQIKGEFEHINSLLVEHGEKSYPDNVNLKELSIGMSGDYEIALQQGSTMIRVGSAIFGERNYY